MFSSIRDRFESTLSYLGYEPESNDVEKGNRSGRLPQKVIYNQTFVPESTIYSHRITPIERNSNSIWKRVTALAMNYLFISIGQSSLLESQSSRPLVPTVSFTAFTTSLHCLEPWTLPLTFIVGLSTFPHIAYSHSVKTTFFDNIGGMNNDLSNAVMATPEGDFIVTGYTLSFGAGSYDVLLANFASNGTLLWAKTLGGINDDRGYSLAETSEGDLIVAGHIASFGMGGTDTLLTKFSSNGTLLWVNALGGANIDESSALTVTSEGDLIVVGYTSSFGAGNNDVLLSKFASNGTLLWVNTFGGESSDYGYTLTVTYDGDIFVAGNTGSFGAGSDDVLLAKFSRNGTLLWANTLGGVMTDYGNSLIATPEGDVIVAADTGSFGVGNSDMLLAKFSNNGTLLWANTLGGTAQDRSRSLASTQEGDLFVVGNTRSFGTDGDDVLLAKLSSNGTLLWANTLGSESNDYGNAIAISSEGDLIVAGYTDSMGKTEVLLAKFDLRGVIENCSAWQSITPQVQSITTTILTDVTLNMSISIPPWIAQDARGAVSVTDITNLFNRTTECYARTFLSSRSTKFLESSSSISIGTLSSKSSPSSSFHPSENFLSTDERVSVNSPTAPFGSTSQVHSLTSVSTREESQIDSSVTIESIISGEVTVINHPLYGEIPVSYDPETNTLYLSIDLSEFEDGDELELFTYASNFTVDDLSIIVESYSTCKTLENAGAEEESDRSVYVARVVDKSCASGTPSIRISSSSLIFTTVSLLPSK